MENTRREYSCIVVDDEPLAIELIERHLQKWPSIQVRATFIEAREARRFVLDEQVDLIFLDVNMPGLSGTELIKSLPSKPKFVFTTAHAEYALDGFNLQAVDFLLKPITLERFSVAVQKVFDLWELEERAESSTGEAKLESIVVKSGHELIPVKVEDILFVESLHKYVRISTAAKAFTTLYAISALEQELPQKQFFRCHRSFIVNLEHVEGIKGHMAKVGGQQVPVSRGKKAELLKRLGQSLG